MYRSKVMMTIFMAILYAILKLCGGGKHQHEGRSYIERRV